MWIMTDEKGEKISNVKQGLDCYRVEAWVESKRRAVVAVGEMGPVSVEQVD